MKTTFRLPHATALFALLLTACHGGGGGGGGGGNGGGGATSTTFSVQLTDVELQDTRRNLAVGETGLPIGGATITRN